MVWEQCPMLRFPLKLSLVFLIATVSAAAFAADRAIERFGDLSYDQDDWIVTALNKGYAVRAKATDDDDAMLSFIKVTSARDDVCRADDFPERREGYYGRTRISTIKRPGFDIHVAEYDIGCRNWRPPTVAACTTYGDKTYRFSSPVVGCRGGPPLNGGFTQFLSGLNAAPAL
jgi:hypothetical protein